MICAIGDIHGQFAMLTALLNELDRQEIGPEDTLVFLGDFIDRGENSWAVVEHLLELRENRPNCVFLRGNHEQLMLDARDGDPPRLDEETGGVLLSNPTLLWFQNGGIETLLSYSARFDAEELLRWWEYVPSRHWDFIRETDFEYVTERYHFVHAGVLPTGKRWEHEDIQLDPRLWIREPFLSSRDTFGGRTVVFGHTPQLRGNPLVKRNKIGIDTAAVYGGPLTAVIVDTDSTDRKRRPFRFVQAPHIGP